MSPWRCAVCWDAIDPKGKEKFCGYPCKRRADADRQARKRRPAQGVRKYPRDDKGGYINQRTPWKGRGGLNFILPTDRPEDLEVRHGIMRGVQCVGTPSESWSVSLKTILTSECPVSAVSVGRQTHYEGQSPPTHTHQHGLASAGPFLLTQTIR